MKKRTLARWAPGLVALLLVSGFFPPNTFDGLGATRVDRSVPAAPAAPGVGTAADLEIDGPDSAGPAGGVGGVVAAAHAPRRWDSGYAGLGLSPSAALQGFLARPTRAPPAPSG